MYTTSITTNCQRSPPPEYGPVTLVVPEGIDRDELPSTGELLKLWQDAGPPPREGLSEDQRRWLKLIDEGTLQFKAEIKPSPEPEVQITTSHEQLGFRWPDIAVKRQFTETHYTKFAVLDQEMHLLFPLDRDWLHKPVTVPAFPNVYQLAGKWRQFAFGIGYSDIIASVENCVRNDDLYELDVKIDWWSTLEGVGSLTVDEDLVVRSADFTIAATRVVVETDGTYRAPDRKFACATQGTFDKTAGERHELQFKTSFTSLTFGMDDLTFDDLASMEAPENLGRLENVDGKVIQTRKAAPERLATPESSWRRYLVILNAVVITAFLLWVWRTKRKAGDVT